MATDGHGCLGVKSAVEVDVVHDLDAVEGAELQDVGCDK